MIAALARKARFQTAAEAGGWLTLRQPRPDLTGKSAAELLALTASLPGNFRLAIHAGGAVELVGEVRNDWDDPAEAALTRLTQELDSTAASDGALPAEDVVHEALDASGLPWARRGETWAIPVSADIPRELQVQRVPGGTRVEAVLVEWDEEETAALARFLAAAQAGLCFARCTLDGRSARLVSQAAGERLERDLRHSLLAVAAGSRFLVREARALLWPETARTYLKFHGIVE